MKQQTSWVFSFEYYRLPLISENEWKRIITNGFAAGPTMAVVIAMVACFDLQPTHEAMEQSFAPKIPRHVGVPFLGVKQKTKRRHKLVRQLAVLSVDNSAGLR